MTKRIKIISLVATALMGVVIILFALFQLYQNGKTDGFLSGRIVITSCKEADWAWKVYVCRGDYNSSAGAIGIQDVTVRVTGAEYSKGDWVGDVYPLGFTRLEDARYFITGRERSSVAYNAPWVALLFLSVLLPIGMVFYMIGTRLGSKKRG